MKEDSPTLMEKPGNALMDAIHAIATLEKSLPLACYVRLYNIPFGCNQNPSV